MSLPLKNILSDASLPVVDSEEIFGHNPDLYDHARIGYDPRFIKQIYDNIKPSHGNKPHVVDAGAGTGRLGEQFLKLGCEVTFVEPNKKSVDYMRHHIGLVNGRPNPAVHIIGSEMQNTGLLDRSADVIVMGDSAHWMKAAAAKEISRILRPEGKVAVFSRFWSVTSPLTMKVDQLLRQECPEYITSTTKLKRTMPNFARRQGRHVVSGDENFTYGFTSVNPYTKDGLMDYFKTCSFSTLAIERDEARFRANVIDPLWEYGKKKGLVKEEKLQVPYEINARFGPSIAAVLDETKSPSR